MMSEDMNVASKSKFKIKSKKSAKDWRDALIDIGTLMKENGLINDDYIEAMIKNVEDNGPYIVVAPNLALAHASSSHGVLKTGYSVIKYEEGVDFGNTYNDPVTILIGFTAKSHEDHLDFIKNISYTLDNEVAMGKLLYGTREEVIKILEEGVI